MKTVDNTSTKKRPVCICWQENEMDSLKVAAHHQLMSVSEFLRTLFHSWLEKQNKKEE